MRGEVESEHLSGPPQEERRVPDGLRVRAGGAEQRARQGGPDGPRRPREAVGAGVPEQRRTPSAVHHPPRRTPEQHQLGGLAADHKPPTQPSLKHQHVLVSFLERRETTFIHNCLAPGITSVFFYNGIA